MEITAGNKRVRKSADTHTHHTDRHTDAPKRRWDTWINDGNAWNVW